jgi:beta-glucanase (GH16 family)
MRLAVCLGIGLLFSFVTFRAYGDDWKLVWSDDFQTPAGPSGALDPKKWTYEAGMPRNGEAQCYTRDRRENVRIEDGCLVIEARKERYEVPNRPGRLAEYTSGSIQTAGKFDFLYGRLEVKARLPTGRGTWPAIWMMPADSGARWPACGEIDVMENVGFEPDAIHGTVHTRAYNHVRGTEKGGSINIARPFDAFHLYAMEWDAKKIDFFVDDAKYFTFKNEGNGADTWPFDKPFYLKLNLAIGGDWGGRKGIDEGIFPQKYYISYVRVYQHGTP